MSNRARTCYSLVGVLPLLAAPAAADEAWFRSTGFLHEFPTAIESHSTGLSPNGSICIGLDTSYDGTEATVWTLAGGLVGLGDLPGSPVQYSLAGDVTNGGVIVGTGAWGTFSQRAYRWTEATGMVALGRLPGHSRSSGAGVSWDGSIVVGSSGHSTFLDQRPFRWTADTGMTPLGLPDGFSSGVSTGISADGSVIVGNGNVTGGRGAWRWTEAGGFVDIGSLGGSLVFTAAGEVSGDGRVVVGNGYSPNGFEAFMWTPEGGIVGLGDLPGGAFLSYANGGTSYDGSIIVGGSQSGEYASDAFIWDAVNKMRSLKQVLQDEYKLNLTGWNLEEAGGISADGLTISGWGYNPDGHREGWVAHIPRLRLRSPPAGPQSPDSKMPWP